MRLTASTLCLVSVLAHADAVLVDRVVAVVDSTPITKSAVADRARSIESMSGKAISGDQARREALTELVDEILVANDAERLHLTVAAADVDGALQQIATQNQFSIAQLGDELRKQGLTMDGYRVMLKKKLLEMRWVNAKMDHAKRPDAPDLNQYIADERNRLIAELRKAAAIEVRP